MTNTQTNTQEVAHLQTVLMITKAQIIASRFPGLDISLNEEGNFRITHSIDSSFNQDNVPLNELLVSTKSVLLELRARYGHDGELLDKASLAFVIHALPAK